MIYGLLNSNDNLPCEIGAPGGTSSEIFRHGGYLTRPHTFDTLCTITMQLRGGAIPRVFVDREIFSGVAETAGRLKPSGSDMRDDCSMSDRRPDDETKAPQRAGKGVGPLYLERDVFVLAAVAVLALALGCGGGSSDTAQLKGRITIDGQPIPADAIGSITLQTTKPGQGKTVGAPLVEGRYELPEAPLGPLRAFIIVQQPTGRTIDNGRGTPAPEYQNIISDEYSSGVGVEVVGDKDDQDFDLKRS